MTQKDYIKRGNPKAAGRNTKNARGKKPAKAAGNAPVAEQSKPLPWAAMVIASMVLASFGYFLWTINGAARTSPGVNQAPKVVAPAPKVTQTQVTANKSEPDIPPPPKQEKWQYMDELKRKEVEVEVKELEKKGPYLMQCATFRDNERAEAFRAQLALLGFESRIKKTKSSKGGHHYRVQLGPYEMNRDAQKARHKLSRHNINGCKIWLWS